MKNKEEFRIYPDGWVDPGANRDRTGQKIDARLTQPDSRPVRYELIDRDGGRRGSFKSPQEAVWWARDVWPDQEQDPDRTGKGWDIEIVP